MVTLEYFFEEGQKTSPFSVRQLKPIQMPNMDMDELREGRRKFTAEPKVWHHDILKPDGTPHIPSEVELLKSVTAEKKKKK